MRTVGFKYKALPVLAAVVAFVFYGDMSWSEKSASPQAQAQKKDEIKTSITGYEYTSFKFRDPFVPLIKVREEKIKGGSAPLEESDIADLKLIAILWNKKGYYAVIQLPDGKGYTVREGAVLGLNGGVVKKIAKDEIVINEKVRDQRGIMGPKDTIIKLHREDE